MSYPSSLSSLDFNKFHIMDSVYWFVCLCTGKIEHSLDQYISCLSELGLHGSADLSVNPYCETIYKIIL